MDPAEGAFIVLGMSVVATTVVLIFRPISTRLGQLLEAAAISRMKASQRTDDDVSALLLAIDDVQHRLRRIESRLDALPPPMRRAQGLPDPDRLGRDELATIAARIRGPHSDGSA